VIDPLDAGELVQLRIAFERIVARIETSDWNRELT
jgi:hypothetical protein